MSEPINLRRVRKQRERDAKRARGDANAAQHGQTKAVREKVATLTRIEARRLDGAKREKDDE